MVLNNTQIFVGTSGYNYEDWKGTFVSEDTDSFDLLSHYVSAKYNFLEITYTLYRQPLSEKIKGIIDRTGDNLKLSIRLNKNLMRREIAQEEIDAFKRGIEPAMNAGKLAALFADFHYRFTASRENFDMILNIKEIFKDYPLFFELVNSTWHKARFYEEFKEAEVPLCVVDGPSFKGFAPFYPYATKHGAYFRLYGRSKSWINYESKSLDYSYSVRELSHFMQTAIDLSPLTDNIFISFCNVEKGNAPKNAQAFINLINRRNQGVNS